MSRWRSHSGVAFSSGAAAHCSPRPRRFTSRPFRRFTSQPSPAGRAGGDARHYFGTTCWLPPGEPGGGITGMVPWVCAGGSTAIPGSTPRGGCSVPCCCASLSLKVGFLDVTSFPAGAICSGGGDGALGGAIGVGVTPGGAGCGFCAAARGAAIAAQRHIRITILRVIVPSPLTDRDGACPVPGSNTGLSDSNAAGRRTFPCRVGAFVWLSTPRAGTKRGYSRLTAKDLHVLA